LAIALAVVGAFLIAAVPAESTFPGKNGRIGFSTYVNGGSYEVFSMNADGTDEVNLSRDPISDLEPAWSPDGTRLLWTRGFFDNYEVWSMNADGSGRRNLSNDPRPDIAAAWSGDGRKIVFSTDRDQVSDFYNDFDLWLMNPDGSGLEQLTSNLGANLQDVNPAWSPDGQSIAFAHGTVDARNLRMIDVETKATRVLTTGAWDDEEPSWSPDGTKIAFSSTRTGSGDIYVMNADGTGPVRLTDGGQVDRDPAWSPDGTKIAFIRSPFDYGGQLYLMDADGSEPASPTGSSTKTYYQVDWQPIPGPKRADYKNANAFCKAEQAFWGSQFASRYGGDANAFGKCVSQS
jgi:TolB protein